MATRFLPLSFPLVFLLAVAPACADTILYENGSINESNGTGDPSISGNGTTDSFTLATESIVTGLEFAVWVSGDATPYYVTYTIGTSPFDSSLGGSEVVVGQPGVTDSLLCDTCGVSSLYSLSNPISPGVVLGAGTYWLTLSGFASSTRGAGGLWGESDGPSTAYYQDSANNDISVDSEWFEIIGNAVPEPSSFTFVVLGCLLLAGWKWRARRLVRGSHR